MLVVNDFMPDINGFAEFFERALDNIHGAHNAGAKAPWLGQQDL
jgi:hypothetical protein